MTNADKIRQMSDEELAEILSILASCRKCPVQCKGGFSRCDDFWLDWLQQEVEE